LVRLIIWSLIVQLLLVVALLDFLDLLFAEILEYEFGQIVCYDIVEPPLART
jgi:hypothetical protein